ncbi:MAG: hypothetical protein HKN23_03335 [Verrucomicrobiales bacterium]|nr:hypothetical protein [Verrucomicrobiales bacterium]
MSDSTNDTPAQKPMSSPMQDLRKLKRNGQATADEIRDFLAGMHGKSASEVLGAIASSSLGKATIQSSIGVAAFVLVFTLIPWTVSLVAGDGEKLKQPEDPAAAEVAKADESDSGEEGETTEKGKGDETAKGEIEIDLLDKKGAAEKLGVTEEKTAPANVNPLDGSNDDLLKGLE